MKINLAIKRLVYEVNAPFPLPFKEKFPTNTLRGAFGYSLVQVMAREQCIGESGKVDICKQLFFPNGISEKGQHLNSARPFVLREYYTREDKKSFILEMLIFGRIAKSECLIDNIVKNMCEMGLGVESRVCRYLKIHSEDINPVIPDFSSGMCYVNFQTPTRIKKEGKYFETEIPFQNLFLRFADRLKELCNVYSDEPCEFSLSHLIEKSKQVGMVVEDASYHTINRLSTKTGDKCNLSGFTGKILYTGNLQPFAEVLSYLPWINVGSSTAFGCGWCTLEYVKLV